MAKDIDKEKRLVAQNVQAKIDADAENARDTFVHAAERAAAKGTKDPHPIPASTFKSIVKIYNEEFPRLRKDIENDYMHSPDRAHLVANIEGSKKEMFNRLNDRIAKLPGGTEAWAKIGDQADGEGFFAPAIKTVFDSDRGGPQWGGIGGLVVGGLLVQQLTAGMGPIINILATLLGGGLLAYLGDKFIDKHPEPPKLPDFHSGLPTAKSPDTATGHAKAKSYDEMLASHTPSNHPVDNHQLIPQTLPNQPAKGRSGGVQTH